eukprot:CAMPEP_0195519848 /NCGR_PEP_ID=MMETSP0794_2-20130614/15622_1 /TAXON_ID=515487 /ORGANISM="Stephanopyxis turris, Strain CCMP 815" /LENGTH=250 /DNA_ID=CAMNT_0040649079 /DNA_START=316 /DNA_END=1068 /DNA_ORIENTATION=-
MDGDHPYGGMSMEQTMMLQQQMMQQSMLLQASEDSRKRGADDFVDGGDDKKVRLQPPDLDDHSLLDGFDLQSQDQQQMIQQQLIHQQMQAPFSDAGFSPALLVGVGDDLVGVPHNHHGPDVLIDPTVGSHIAPRPNNAAIVHHSEDPPNHDEHEHEHEHEHGHEHEHEHEDEDEQDEDEDDDSETDSEETSEEEEEIEGLFTVTVLPGYSQGMTMRFRTPKGTVCTVQIPEGINAGDSFRVAVQEESPNL